MSQNPNHNTVFAFIDSQNLNMGIGEDVNRHDRTIHSGWRLDFKKLRVFLRDKYKVETAFLFIGNVPGNEALYEHLQRAGYLLVLKPTTSYKDAEGKVHTKGNVDTDLVLYAGAKEINNYDHAVVVSGDGDFLSLYDYLAARGKLGTILIPNKLNYSQLLTKYADRFDFVSTNRRKLEKDRPGYQKTPRDPEAPRKEN